MPNPTAGSGTVGFSESCPAPGISSSDGCRPGFVDVWDRAFRACRGGKPRAAGRRWHEAWSCQPGLAFRAVAGRLRRVGVGRSDGAGRRSRRSLFPDGHGRAACRGRRRLRQALRESQRWFDALEQTTPRRGQPRRRRRGVRRAVVALPGPLDAVAATRQRPAGHGLGGLGQWRMPLRMHGHDEGFLGGAVVAGCSHAGAGWCLWWTHGAGAVPASVMLTQGLPAPSGFAAFLDAGQADDSWHTLRAFAASPPALARAGAADAVRTEPARGVVGRRAGDGSERNLRGAGRPRRTAVLRSRMTSPCPASEGPRQPPRRRCRHRLRWLRRCRRRHRGGRLVGAGRHGDRHRQVLRVSQRGRGADHAGRRRRRA